MFCYKFPIFCKNSDFGAFIGTYRALSTDEVGRIFEHILSLARLISLSFSISLIIIWLLAFSS